MLKTRSEPSSLVVTVDLAQMFANESKHTKLEALRIATQAQRTTAYMPLIKAGLRLVWWAGLIVLVGLPAGGARKSPNALKPIASAQVAAPITASPSQ